MQTMVHEFAFLFPLIGSPNSIVAVIILYLKLDFQPPPYEGGHVGALFHPRELHGSQEGELHRHLRSRSVKLIHL